MAKGNSPYFRIVFFQNISRNLYNKDEQRNTISKLYNAVSAPVAATRDALAERLQSVREAASLLYNGVMDNIGYGREILKDIIENEAEEQEANNNSNNKMSNLIWFQR